MNSAEINRMKDAIPTGAAEKIAELTSKSDAACAEVLKRVSLPENEGGFSNEQLQQLEVALYAADEVLSQAKDPDTIMYRLTVLTPTFFWLITLAPTTVLGPAGGLLAYAANLLYIGGDYINYKWAKRKQDAGDKVRELRQAIKSERVKRGVVASHSDVP